MGPYRDNTPFFFIWNYRSAPNHLCIWCSLRSVIGCRSGDGVRPSVQCLYPRKGYVFSAVRRTMSPRRRKPLSCAWCSDINVSHRAGYVTVNSYTRDMPHCSRTKQPWGRAPFLAVNMAQHKYLFRMALPSTQIFTDWGLIEMSQNQRGKRMFIEVFFE